MTSSIRRRAGVLTLTAGCVLVAVTGCSLSPDDLPSVGEGVGASYPVTLQFAGAMNLPAGADVMMDGLRVGQVRSVTVEPAHVDVTVRLKDGTDVPADIRAAIRQNTLLGDTYIALDHGPVTTTPYLRAGDTVPVDHTSSPPQLEDTMAVLAYFVNGGSIQKIEDAMGGINTVMPPQRDVPRLASVVSVDLRNLAGDTGEIDRTLNGLNATAVSLDDKSRALATMFSQPAEHYWRRVAVSIVSYISQILPSVGSVYEGGLWMVPMLDALADSGGVIRSLWDHGPSDTAKLANFLSLTLLPFAANPSVDIRSVQTAQGQQVIGDVQNLLRMLGAAK